MESGSECASRDESFSARRLRLEMMLQSRGTSQAWLRCYWTTQRKIDGFWTTQFAVFSGQPDWLLPCLVSGGRGCVTGIGNVFPRSVVELYSLWHEGKIDEARQSQGQIAQAESACKKGLAATKSGTRTLPVLRQDLMTKAYVFKTSRLT